MLPLGSSPVKEDRSILDKSSIHNSRFTREALRRHRGCVVLHLMPPFCPDENPIERLWQDLHASLA